MEEALHYIPLTLFTLLALLGVDTIGTAYTIQIALHCLNSSMHASLGNVRTLLEWADGLLTKMLGDGVDWSGWIPLRLLLLLKQLWC